jgi:PEP-CTERM motif
MQSSNRVAVVSGLLLSLLLLPAFSRETYAARIDIDNDVAIEWQQKAYANFLPTVVNGNFVVTNEDELNAVLLAIAVTRTDLLGGISLTLNLVDPLSQDAAGTYSEILSGTTALKLTFTAGEDNSGQPLAGVDPAADGFHTSQTFIQNLSLSDFHNSLQTFDEDAGEWVGPSTYDLLLDLLASGPIGFSLDGHIYGSVKLPADLACQQDPTVCKTFPGSASITESGGQAFPTTAVPEPASLSLLLVGSAGVAALRRRRRS